MRRLILLVGLSLIALVLPLVSAGETVGIGCFYEHPKGTPHDHPAPVWEEVSEENPLVLSNDAGEGYVLVCKNWLQQEIARVASQKVQLWLEPEGCCLGGACGVSVGGFCRAAKGDLLKETQVTISCQAGDHSWQVTVSDNNGAEITAEGQAVFCRDGKGGLVAEVRPGNMVVITLRGCGFLLPEGSLSASRVALSPYGKCRGALLSD